MAAKSQKVSIKHPQKNKGRHDRNLLLALSRAAQSIQQARTPEEVYRALGEQIKSLKFDAIVLTKGDDNQHLNLSYLTFPANLLEAGMKLTGLSLQDFRFPISPDSIHERVIKNRKGEFGFWTSDAIAEALPEALRPLSGQLAHILKIEKCVVAPLCTENGEALGVLTVASSFITEEDIPAIESFAAQVTISLNNIRLRQQIEQELSERKDAEKALQISQATFEGIFNSITEAVYILDENGFFLKVNSGAEKMYGHSTEYFVGRTPEFISAPGKNKLANVLELINQAYLGQSVEFEFWGLRKDGTIFPKEVRLTPGSYFGKKVVIAVGRDITERKQVEETVRQAERHFKALIENATDGILVVDMEGKIRYESPSVTRLLGYGPDALIGTSAFDLINPDDLPEIVEAFMKGLSTPGFIHRGEYRLRNCTGEWRYFEIVSRYMMDDPVIAGIIINGRDITERKQAEAELLESKLRFQRLADNARDIIFRYSIQPDMQLTYINPAVKLITGYTPEECYADPMLMLNMVHPDDLPVMVGYMQSLEPPTHPMFMRWIGKDGVTRWMESRIVPITDSSGQLIVVEGITRNITERKLAEEALRESESKFHRVISESADGIALTDESGCIIEFNNAFEQITGYNRHKVVGQFLWDFQFHLSPKQTKTNEYYVRVKEAIQKTLKTGHSVHHNIIMEVPFERPDGSVRYIQQRLFSIRTDKGWQLGSISRDVTEQKQADQTLRISEERFRVLYEDNPSMYFTTDGNGLVVSVNRFCKEQLGYEKEELVGQPLLNVFHPDDRKTVQQQFIFCLQNIKQTIQMDARKIRKNGTIIWVRESACAVHDLQGQVVVLLICEDITERKQAEAALIRSEQAYRTLFENMPIGLYRTSIDGQLLDANPALIRILGYTDKQSLLAENAQNLYADPDADLRFREQIKEKKVLSGYEAKFRRKDGTLIWAEDYVRTTYDENSTPLYFEGSLVDITERKQAEYELLQTKETLEVAHNELQNMFMHEQVLARTDGLTGLYNRRHFFELAVREFNASIRYQRPLTIILFDVDDFKHANDNFGHALGDRILAQVSQITAMHIREVDILARYGGDEFIILLPETTAQQAYLIAERIRLHIASIRIEIGEKPLSLTISIGIAESNHAPEDKFIEDVIHSADEALYNAKKNGRNFTSIYTHP